MIPIVLVAALVLGLFLLIRTQSKRERIVMQTSPLIQEFLAINKKYAFYKDIRKKYAFRKNIQTKPKFDRLQISEVLDEAILTDVELIQVLQKIAYNRTTYDRYQNEIHHLKSEITEEKAKSLQISYANYVSTEQHIVKREQFRPILDSRISCSATYVSPKGRNRYFKSCEYTVTQALDRVDELNRMIAFQNTEEMRRKQERARMTDKLRFSILQRDGYRCKICGRTANDGVRLHVDHIMPISKGGKTVPSNLQTLCEACNLGKSDTI